MLVLLGGLFRSDVAVRHLFCLLSVFHLSEFVMTHLYHPETLTFDSFLLNQSREYQLCVLCSWTEYWLGVLFLPEEYKTTGSVLRLAWMGVILTVLGQTVRTVGMWQAGKAFTHL